jgi:hypothetical protein
MAIEITLTTILIFVGFILTVFVLYKLLKFFFRASLVVAASFAFPWVAKYLGLSITTNLETGILFAITGFTLFCIYELFHFIVQFFKIITWPFRRKKR